MFDSLKIDRGSFHRFSLVDFFSQLAHIRLPPGFTSSTAELKPRKVHSGLVSGQVSILCSEDHGTDYDSMWSLVSVGDNSSNQPEEYGVSRLDGRVWCCDAIDDVQVKFDKIIFPFRTKTFRFRNFLCCSSEIDLSSAPINCMISRSKASFSSPARETIKSSNSSDDSFPVILYMV